MRILYVEPFAGGSHAAFGRVLMRGIAAEWTALEQPGRHWKWHMRAAAAHALLEQGDTLRRPYDAVLASSYTPLAELVGLAPQLATVPRLLYFHENQLAFPTRQPEHAERDLHFGVTQLVSALAATRCLFNSRHNQTSFLAAAHELLARMPDAPRGWVSAIADKSEVVPVPLELADEPPALGDDDARARGPILLWNHRWEFDKDPAAFVAALRELDLRGVPFRVAICGQRFARVPAELADAPQWLGDRLVHYGELPSRADYLALLGRAHVVVSTAIHEFFGVAVLEAIHAGARPLVPDRLSYPELVPERFRYRDHAALVDTLAALCRDHVAGRGEPLRADRRAIVRPYLASAVLPRFAALLGV